MHCLENVTEWARSSRELRACHPKFHEIKLFYGGLEIKDGTLKIGVVAERQAKFEISLTLATRVTRHHAFNMQLHRRVANSSVGFCGGLGELFGGSGGPFT